jgi:hypothetical protein
MTPPQQFLAALLGTAVLSYSAGFYDGWRRAFGDIRRVRREVFGLQEESRPWTPLKRE